MSDGPYSADHPPPSGRPALKRLVEASGTSSPQRLVTVRCARFPGQQQPAGTPVGL